MRIGIIHNFYSDGSPSGENLSVNGMIAKISSEFENTSLWTGSNTEKLLSKSSLDYLFRHLIFDYKKKSFENWLFQNTIVQIHNNFPLLTRANLKSLRKFGESHRILRVVHNYRMTCLRGNHHRKEAGCNLCSSHTFTPGIIRGCYRSNRILSLLVARNTRLLTEIVSQSESSLYIGISPHVSQYILNIVQNEMKVKTIMHQIDNPAQEISPDADEVLYLGRLDPEKDVLTFLKAWVTLLANEVEMPRLNLVGSGQQEKLIKSIARDFPDQIVVHGFLSGSALENVIKNCKIFVFTSSWVEPFGRTLIEAASRGMFLIGVDNPVLRTLINPTKNGLILSRDYSNLEACIRVATQSVYSVHLDESKTRFLEMYSITKEGKWVEFYRNLE